MGDRQHDRQPDAADPVLLELAAAYGIDTQYWDWRGELHDVSVDSLRAVLAAFDVDTSSVASCADALARRVRPDRPLPPCVVRRAGQLAPVPVAGPRVLAASVRLEDGTERALALAAAAIELPGDLPTGYHEMRVQVVGRTHTAALIVAPDRLRLPPALGAVQWGLAAQLYSVRSAGSWGTGDLHDLITIACWSAEQHGAGFVLVNPLHAGDVVPPLDPSPYLPTSRRFADPLYLCVPDLPEYATAADTVRARVDAVGAQARAAADDALIDRDAAWLAKREALELLLADPLTERRAAAFDAYRERAGAALDVFATWCVLCEEHGNDWHSWPAELRDPASAATARFATDHVARIDFFRRVQWVLDEQLGATQQAAASAGMGLGVIHDVAVGVSPSGADAWAWQNVLARGVTVGAPPDAYSQLGQDWQQPPWRPDRLAELGYAPLRDLFRNVLRHAGGLRVDHIIGLFRLWWIPPGMPALGGTYVHYDHDALVGILALEAERAGAVLIGEDLGNVEPWVRDYLADRGVFGTSILWFEADDGAPRSPETWRVHCLASVTTHDLPPTTGYLAGEHVRLRDRLGLLTRPVAEELAGAQQERAAWIAELARLGLLPDHDVTDEQVVIALHRFLRRTPSLLRCVALTDAVGERRTQNQPGTRDEYPNWQVPLGDASGRPMLLEDVLTDPGVAAVIGAVASD